MSHGPLAQPPGRLLGNVLDGLRPGCDMAPIWFCRLAMATAMPPGVAYHEPGKGDPPWISAISPCRPIRPSEA